MRGVCFNCSNILVDEAILTGGRREVAVGAGTAGFLSLEEPPRRGRAELPLDAVVMVTSATSSSCSEEEGDDLIVYDLLPRRSGGWIARELCRLGRTTTGTSRP